MKLKSLFLLLVAALIFTACSNNEESSAAEGNNENNNEEQAENEENNAANEEENKEDAVTGATEILAEDEDSLLNGISKDGSWIIIFEGDLTTEEELVLDGDFTHRDEPARKLALYTQDEDHNIIDQFTLTAPKLTITSENTRLQGGTFVGDVYVEANGFSIPDGTIDGNLYFASEEYEASADLSGGEVTGSVQVDGADAVSGATELYVEDEESLLHAISKNGSWIVIFEDDFATEEELVLDGDFTHRDEPARKLALYTQDEDHNIIDQFTLTAPKLTVTSENTRLQGGTFVGDVYVEANGFSIPDGTIDGNLHFASEEYEASADLSGGEVTGSVEVE